MAYRILYGNQILWEPYSDASDSIMDASISMNVNAAKYLDFTIPPTHSLYNVIAERDELIRLYADNKIIYKGYITKITLDMDGYKQVNCSSIMSYLSDTHVRDYSTIEGEQPLKAPTSLDGLFQWYIDQHNEHCMDSDKRFVVGVNQAGVLDENNYVYRSSTQFPTTSSEIEDKILNLGGYIFERYDDDNNILDFYADAHEANTQILDFGVNITDFTQERSGEDQYTAVYATGYTPDPPEDDPEKEMKPISLADIQNGGSPYNSDFFKLGDILYSTSGVQRYGYREYYYSNDDITTTDYLLKAAGVVLTKLLAPTITLDVKAVDMALFMENGYEHLQLGQAVRVRSKPHNIDEYLMISGIDLDLQDPGQTSYTIGATYDTLTGQQSSYLKSLNAGINSSLDSVASLDQATKNAAKDAKEATEKANDAASKANEASSKADQASADAKDASDKATEANNAAKKAQEDAANAISNAKDAADKAADASKKADQNTEKITLVEDTIKTISGDTSTAIANAKAAQDAADAAKAAADKAQTSADTANTEIGKVQSQVENINTEIGNVKQEATDLRDDLSGQITTVKNTMEADYARKTDLSTTESTLRNEITESAAGVIRTVSQDYATKTELATTTEATNKNATDLTNAINKFTSDVDNLQGQIDGAIETWFYEVDPTASNEPAKNWTTDALKKVHLGDLYYNTKSGYCWRYQLQNGTYSWSRITDVDVTKALADAAKAQDTADNKRRVFVTTPNPPYDVGDLWTQGSGGDIMRCQTAKSSTQSYAAADWVKASKYTDDTAVTNLSNTVEKTYSTKSEVKQLSDQVSSVVSSVETVKVSAEAAQTSADNAKKAADDAAAAAKTAKDNAATAQSKADEAAKNLATAEANLKNLQSQADATDEQVAAAKAEVEKAKTAAANAQADATTAKNNAATAQATADTAKTNAKKAQDDVDALKNRVTTAETSIKQNSEAIALRATKTEVTSAIDNIKVGATNLLKNSEFFKFGEDPYGDSTVTKYTNSYFDGQPGYFCSDKLYYQINMTGMTDTSIATISFDIVRTANEQNVIVILQGDSTEHVIGKTGVNAWKRLSYSFTPPANGILYIRIYCNNTSGNNTGTARYVTSLRHIKVEKGNKPTDWSPAPEDLEAYADAQIKVSADSINATVSSVKSTADSALSKANTASSDASTAKTDASTAKSTANTAKSTADSAASTAASKGIDYSQGKMLYTDPLFASGTNSTKVYNNSGNGNVTVTRTSKSSDNPMTGTSYELTIKNVGTSSPETGGFSFQNSSRANAIFIYRIIAKIPSGRTLKWAANAFGSGSTATWLTSTAGTGKFQEYVCKAVCGASGSFSTIGFFYVSGSVGSSSSPVTWYVAYATCFDMTAAGDALTLANNVSTNYATKTSVTQTATDLTTKITTAQSTANTANTNASSALTKSTTLETLIRQSSTGVEVARKVNGSYTSTKTLMASDGFHIQNSSGTDLATFTQKTIELGKYSGTSSDVASIYLLNKNVSIQGTGDSVSIQTPTNIEMRSMSGIYYGLVSTFDYPGGKRAGVNLETGGAGKTPASLYLLSDASSLFSLQADRYHFGLEGSGSDLSISQDNFIDQLKPTCWMFTETTSSSSYTYGPAGWNDTTMNTLRYGPSNYKDYFTIYADTHPNDGKAIFTATKAGYFKVHACAHMTQSNGRIGVGIFSLTNIELYSSFLDYVAANTGSTIQVDGLVSCNVGDGVRIKVFSDNGNYTKHINEIYNYVNIEYLGPLNNGK